MRLYIFVFKIFCFFESFLSFDEAFFKLSFVYQAT
ncbi:hypothetical protein CJA_1215 [Cellvibrio japonicus Ueda107]|uniref:Uncharacterized protein n=1 Tax=Cellvibrio japonicus (strain Ueda107) TaxID=498211 RepID=B3PCA3_CELJU|nr:hypothetical protein CJA_1215 [Cellvibrio japonicus Ueda107]